jgi:hypothetical protein
MKYEACPEARKIEAQALRRFFHLNRYSIAWQSAEVRKAACNSSGYRFDVRVRIGPAISRSKQLLAGMGVYLRAEVSEEIAVAAVHRRASLFPIVAGIIQVIPVIEKGKQKW